MNYTIDLEDAADIYDAVQTGEIPAKMGDTINGKFVMVNGYHCEAIEDLGEGPLFVITETVLNTSTGETFEDRYIAHRPCPSNYKHLKTLSVTTTEITL